MLSSVDLHWEYKCLTHQSCLAAMLSRRFITILNSNSYLIWTQLQKWMFLRSIISSYLNWEIQSWPISINFLMHSSNSITSNFDKQDIVALDFHQVIFDINTSPWLAKVAIGSFSLIYVFEHNHLELNQSW